MAENPYELTEEEKRQLANDLYQASVNPYDPSLLEQAGDAITAGYNLLPDPIQAGLEATGQGAKVVGSTVMDVLAPLD